MKIESEESLISTAQLVRPKVNVGETRSRSCAVAFKVDADFALYLPLSTTLFNRPLIQLVQLGCRG